jgi:pimeloyl-ACP methyl ester carboxylesterase
MRGDRPKAWIKVDNLSNQPIVSDKPALRRGAGLGADGNALAIDLCGPINGPTAILLHGGGQSRSSWQLARRRLGNAGYNSCAFDLRGHGESDWSPNGDYAVDRFVDDLVCVIDKMGAPAILIGASYGGHVALVTAARHRNLVRALILCDVTPWIEGAATRAMRDLLSDAEGGFASLADAARHIERLSGQRADADPEKLRKLMRIDPDGRFHWPWDPRFFRYYHDAGERFTRVLSEAAAALTVPTLLIRAEHSEIVTPKQVDDFVRTVPHAVTTQIPGARHIVTKHDNEPYAALILAFLRTIPSCQGTSTAEVP